MTIGGHYLIRNITVATQLHSDFFICGDKRADEVPGLTLAYFLKSRAGK